MDHRGNKQEGSHDSTLGQHGIFTSGDGNGDVYMGHHASTSSSPPRRPLATKRTHRPSPAFSPTSDLYLHNLTTNVMSSKKMDVRPSPVWIHNEQSGTMGLGAEDAGFSTRADMNEMFGANQRAFAACFSSEHSGGPSNMNPDAASLMAGNKLAGDASAFYAAAAAAHLDGILAGRGQQQQQNHEPQGGKSIKSEAPNSFAEQGGMTQAELLMTPSKLLTTPAGYGNEAAATGTGKKKKVGGRKNAKSIGGGGGRWTKEEDLKLRAAVAACGAQNWKVIATDYLSDSRSDVQCLHRWQKVLQPGLVKGPWTKEEDQIIVDCIEAGTTKWSEIAEQIPGRIGKQCRERWFNHLDPALKKGGWSEEEDAILVEAQAKWGNSWTKIAKLLPGRSENAVKNRWNSATRRRAKQAIRGLDGGNAKSSRSVPFKPRASDAKNLAMYGATLKAAGGETSSLGEDERSQDYEFSDDDDDDLDDVDAEAHDTPEKPQLSRGTSESSGSLAAQGKAASARRSSLSRAAADDAATSAASNNKASSKGEIESATQSEEELFADDVNHILERAAFAAGWSQDEEEKEDENLRGAESRAPCSAAAASAAAPAAVTANQDSSTTTTASSSSATPQRPARRSNRPGRQQTPYKDGDDEQEEVDENRGNADNIKVAEGRKPKPAASRKKAGTASGRKNVDSTGSRKLPPAVAAAGAAAAHHPHGHDGGQLYEMDNSGLLQWEFNADQTGGFGHNMDFLKVDADFDLLETEGHNTHIKEEHLQEDFTLSASLMNISLDKDTDDMGFLGDKRPHLTDAEGKQLSMEDYTNHFLQQMNQAANQKNQQGEGVPHAHAAAAAAAASFRERKPQDLSVDCAGNVSRMINRLRQSPKASPSLPPIATSPGFCNPAMMPFSPYSVPPCSSSSMTSASPTTRNSNQFSIPQILNSNYHLPILPAGLAHAKSDLPLLPSRRTPSPSTTFTGACRPMYTPEDEFLHSPTSPKVNMLAPLSTSSRLATAGAAAMSANSSHPFSPSTSTSTSFNPSCQMHDDAPSDFLA